MVGTDNHLKNNLQIIRNNSDDFESRRKRNATNKFLNTYLKVIIFFLILAFIGLVFYFVLLPKFEEASNASNSTIAAKKSEFINEYNNLQVYRSLINEFEKIDPQDVYKIEKMIPSTYTRDDLFTEIAYLLSENSFKIVDINIIDPRFMDDGAPMKGIASGSKRPGIEANAPKAAYQEKIDAMPGGVSAWVIDLEIVDMDYFKLKKLLTLLENNLKLIDVYSLDFRPSDSSLSIGLITYYKK